jgi:Amidohydrolase
MLRSERVGASILVLAAVAMASVALAKPDYSSPPLSEDQLSAYRGFLKKFDALHLKNPSKITLPLEFNGFPEGLPFIPQSSRAEIIDYHQHLFSPKASERASIGVQGIDADTVVSELDVAGIQRAVVLSVAYGFSNPNKPAVADEYAHVRAENDWTSTQVGRFPQRLLGFCSVNPLREYALVEIARCATDKNLRSGLKLHFGNSDVNVDNPEHLNQLRLVFRAANQHGMAIVVHMQLASPMAENRSLLLAGPFA